jgi:hypothetical protein
LRTISEDASDFLARLIPFVESDGARNLNQISRDMPIPYMTLRKRILKLREKGFAVDTIPDVDKLGLERIRASFELSSSFEKDIRALFGGLHQSAGLRSYFRHLVKNNFDCEFSIPQGTRVELEELLRKLEDMGIISDWRLRKILWKDFLMLKAQFYDFSRGEWDVDFSTLVGDPSTVQIPTKNSQEHFDYPDLLMLKDLELDTWMKTVDLAKRAKLGLPDAAYHLNRHVFGKKLIKCFRFRWIGTKDAWLKHSIVSSTFVFNGISDENTRHAMSILTSLPFTWSHLRTEDGTYMAEVMIPTPKFSETMQFISTQLRSLELKPDFLMKDWSCSSTFTIPYLLYNRENSSWQFDSEYALRYTLQMIKTFSV